MLKIPLDEVTFLFDYIEGDIIMNVKDKYSQYSSHLDIKEVKLMTLVEDDLYITLNSPFAACTYRCCIEIKDEDGIRKVTHYYAYLLDMLGVCVVGDVKEITSSGRFTRRLQSWWDDGALHTFPGYTFDENGLRGLMSVGELNTYPQYRSRSLSLDKFIESINHKYIGGKRLNPYQRWILEFIPLRAAYLNIHINTLRNLRCNPLVKKYEDKVESLRAEIQEDLSSLLDKYPYEGNT